MKIILCFIILLTTFTVKIESKTYNSYCVMDINNKQILQQENLNHKQSVASISKIMTAIIAIEEANLNDKIKIDKTIYSVDGSSIYLKENEVYTLKDLLYGLMLRSGNDAAVMIAKHVSKSQNKFVELMNKKAKQLNMNNTIFNNPSGLDENDGGNISTSCDMALLTSYAMNNKTFRKIVSSKSYKNSKGDLYINKNRFLSLYEHATGGKTGYTKNAGRTLVTTSKKEDMEVVVVTIQINDDFNFHKQKHIEIYDTYVNDTILKKGIYLYKNNKITINEDLNILLKKNQIYDVNIKTILNKNKFSIHVEYDDNKINKTYEVKHE